MTSSVTDPRFRILNPDFQTTDDFSNFSRLPLEIRQKIWESAMSHERLLHIQLGPAQVTLAERLAISKLFHVNSESRYTALNFYRVHLPCIYRHRNCYGDHYPKREVQGVLYLNPELDILNINGHDAPMYFTQFAHDVWAHDRCRVGLVNLALSVEECTWTPDPWSKVPIPTLPLHRKVLSRLERILFIFEADQEDMYLGRNFAPRTRWSRQLYHSGPIMPLVPSFDRLPQDPRRIQRYLHGVYLGSKDPRENIEAWLTHLHNWGVEPGISDREDAFGWVRGEAEQWTSKLQRNHERERNPEKAIREELESAILPDFGFWLFPVEGLGTLWKDADSPQERRRRQRALLWRTPLSDYPPQLCLAHLPGPG
ncbi:hypothetical protein FSARC_7512 [Fusarium sarcochroum]|uniref:2EXR domain-containing protein n=1 Tax=Fusarium sarcochroum TaxID=1208366 RepID=A0A8H4X892_9HYPO|nr:hypothetical protein FSARC_7512 [Fusarium sarcochroum]